MFQISWPEIKLNIYSDGHGHDVRGAVYLWPYASTGSLWSFQHVHQTRGWVEWQTHAKRGNRKLIRPLFILYLCQLQKVIPWYKARTDYLIACNVSISSPLFLEAHWRGWRENLYWWGLWALHTVEWGTEQEWCINFAKSCHWQSCHQGENHHLDGCSHHRWRGVHG